MTTAPATIRTRLQALRRELSGAREDEVTAQKLGHLRTRCESLEKAALGMRRAYATVDALSKAEVEVSLSPPTDELRTALEREIESARRDPLAAGTGDEPSVIGRADSHKEVVAAEARRALGEFRGRNSAPIVDDDMLLTMEGRDGPMRARISRAAVELEKLRAIELPSSDDLERWKRAVAEIRVIHDQIADTAPSEAVAQFLKAVQKPPGATLQMLLHEDVLEYIERQGRTNAYRVRAWGQG